MSATKLYLKAKGKRLINQRNRKLTFLGGKKETEDKVSLLVVFFFACHVCPDAYQRDC
jgi:hypothetical protein